MQNADGIDEDDEQPLQADLLAAFRSWVAAGVPPERLRSRFVSQLTAASKQMDATAMDHVETAAFQRVFKANETWQEFCLEMCADLADDEYAAGAEFACAQGYLEIDERLRKAGVRLHHFDGLFSVPMDVDEEEATPSPLEDEEQAADDSGFAELEPPPDEGVAERARRQYAMLNDEQKQVFDEVAAAVASDDLRNRCFFVSGRAGTGKTFLYNALCDHVVSQPKIGDCQTPPVLCVASTGIAASLLTRGRTAHKAFNLPLNHPPAEEFDLRMPPFSSELGKELRGTRLVIWDEMTMNSAAQLDYLDRLFRFYMKSEEPFGGKTILLGGDFRQLLLVNRQGDGAQPVCFADVWPRFRQLELRTNMRANEDAAFREWLRDVGDGRENPVRIPRSMMLGRENVPLSDLLFGRLIADGRFEELGRRAIIATTNQRVDFWNTLVHEMLPDHDEEIFEAECGEDGGPADPDDDAPSQLPATTLSLRPNAIVSLMVNLDVAEGLCNGTRLRFLRSADHRGYLLCAHVGGARDGQEVEIPRIKLYRRGRVAWQRQFPLRLAFALTVHRAQGQTFERAALDLTHGPFAHGHLYVALSRVSHRSRMRVYSPQYNDEDEFFLVPLCQKRVISRLFNFGEE